MYCPKCSQVLIAIERDKIELEYCSDCGGFWLDVDEWNLIKKTLGINNETEDLMKIPPVALKKTGEKARYCPVCTKIMEKIETGNIVLDRCVDYHGIWFDKQELSSFMNSNADKNQNKFINFLGENFIK